MSGFDLEYERDLHGARLKAVAEIEARQQREPTDGERLARLRQSSEALLKRIDRAQGIDKAAKWAGRSRSTMKLREKCAAIQDLGSRGYLDLPD